MVFWYLLLFSKIDMNPEVFSTNFQDSQYSGKEASYVLKKIESYQYGEFVITETSDKASLEHILPQTLSDPWKEDFDEITHKKICRKNW